MIKKLAAVLGWVSITAITLAIAVSAYANISGTPQKSYRPKISVVGPESITSNAVLPEVIGAFTYTVKSEDAIPEIIKSYLKKYNSPLLVYADYLVETSRAKGIDPRLMVAIAQQESNLCKKIPENSFNCWGYGIHSKGTLRFENYELAIKSYAEYLKREYFDKGLNTPELIMKKYCPSSNGSWAFGVNKFLNDIERGDS